ncbi:MAG: hypothetical protein P794_01810 [Epsilonproteobacteria bacterium (ex Lamellibrachia satsuma)]|nr:MAG: hypothetical protein P794_01810 [Epsilonproteobacteria bacterium (ex Lamellibrachia satsuma)]
MDDERKIYEKRRISLQRRATKKDKEEAVKKLKKLHNNNVDIYYQLSMPGVKWPGDTLNIFIASNNI